MNPWLAQKLPLSSPLTSPCQFCAEALVKSNEILKEHNTQHSGHMDPKFSN